MWIGVQPGTSPLSLNRLIYKHKSKTTGARSAPVGTGPLAKISFQIKGLLIAGTLVGGALIELGPLGIVAGMATDYAVTKIATGVYDHYHGGPPRDEQ